MSKDKAQGDEREVVLTRSFSRKLNMSAHGGKQYETTDISASVTANVPASKIEKSSAQLDAFVQAEVQKTIDAFDEAEGVDEKDEEEDEEEKPAKKKKMIDVGVKVDQDDLDEIQEYVNDLSMAKNPAELKEAVAKIKLHTAAFNETQKGYLGAYYAKRKAAISE